MSTRWKKAASDSPQLGLGLAPRRPWPPTRKATTDTSAKAAESVGASFERGTMVGDLAKEMLGVLRGNRQRQVLAGAAIAVTVRNEILDHLERIAPEGATADELAAALKRSPFTTRPRCTELQSFGKIHDSGRRRKNASGRNAIVWVRG